MSRLWESTSFAADIEAETDGEPIEAIVILAGDPRWDRYWDDERAIPDGMKDRPLPWDEARPLLDKPYDTGYGSQDCPDIHAWTRSRVLSIHEYDGSTGVIWVPRNPPSPSNTPSNRQNGA